MHISLSPRAWVEINLDNLRFNLDKIKNMLPPKSQIIAVVKANAYGHGLVRIAQELEKLGINFFATATTKEAIILRKNHIKSDILVLGYTPLEDIRYVKKYHLIQTIVTSTHLKELLSSKQKIRAHLKINTGMNRLGLEPEELDLIIEGYQSPNLSIEGIYTHLCVSDSSSSKDISYTKEQIARFNNLINLLHDKKIDPGKIHLQSSYGLLNCGDLNYDYVRVGLIMYGINSTTNMPPLPLKPVLSLKTKIISIRKIKPQTSVSYGRTYISKKEEKIAVLSIGYADGYPRILSGKDVKVLVNGHYERVIGRICMDQMLITIDDDAKVGDTVTLIGEEEDIKAEVIAAKAKTITYELLSRLGSRLDYKYIDKK